jgi:glycosyltransferase involved in cell wall biosynthesis
MKIALFAWGAEDDTKVWSGTPSTLNNLFKEKGFETAHVDMSSMLNIWHYRLRTLMKKLGFDGLEKLPLLFQRLGQCVSKVDETLEDNTSLFFISSNAINKPLKKTHHAYIYVDAVARPRQEFSPKPSFPKSIVRKYGLNKYEEYDKLSYSFATKIFTQNEWSRKYIIDAYGVPSEKVINVGFGVNLTFYKEEKDYTRNLLLIVLRKGLEEPKGFNLLLPAFRIAKQTIKDLELAVVGTDGPEEDGVKYYYNQPRSTTVQLFKECVLYTMPALNEPNGITYLEALTNKAPILGLNRFSVPEFTGYGKYGFYTASVTPESVAELIIEALSDKSRLKVMGEAGQKFVEKRYTWNKVIDEMIKVMK